MEDNYEVEMGGEEQYEYGGEQYGQEGGEISETLINADGEVIHIAGCLRGIKPKEKKNNAEFLFENIITEYFFSKWKKKVETLKILQNQPTKRTGRPDPREKKRLNTKKAVASLDKFMNRKIGERLDEVFEIFQSLPRNPNIVHDENFGKIKIVNSIKLNERAMRKLKFYSKLNFILKINENLGNILLESINKMAKNKGKR